MKIPQPMHSAAPFVSATVGRREQAHVDERRRLARLDREPRGEEPGRGGGERERGGRGPAELAALRHEDQQRRERAGQQRGAEPVDPGAGRAGRRRGSGGRRPAPGSAPGRPIQKIADGPAWSTITPASAGPSAAPTPRLTESVPIAAHARGLRERVADDPVGEREDAARGALEDAPADQQRQAVAERADDRAGDEHDHDGGEHPAPPVEVAEPADQRRGDRGGDEVGGEQPGDGRPGWRRARAPAPASRAGSASARAHTSSPPRAGRPGSCRGAPPPGLQRDGLLK